ncbi:MAG: phosphatidylglycerophosphatase A [Psychrobacter sp.]|nr:phosphatidylglycerophosphatase A [Psychrobacter sp.]
MSTDPLTQHKPDISKANVCPPCPSNASAVDKLIYWLGIGLGSGLPQRAPGTWGTVGGLIVAIPLMILGFLPFLIITILASIIGVWICGRTSELMRVHDDPHIVWDEWVGMWITLLPMAYVIGGADTAFTPHAAQIASVFGAVNLLAAFVWFRFFDIIKPFPISWADKKVAGGLGIMLDDLIAGVMALLVILAFWFGYAWFY